MMTTAGTEIVMRGTSSRGATTAASSPTNRAAAAAAAWTTTPASTSSIRTTLATMPTVAAPTAIGHGLLNRSAKPSTPRKLATSRRPTKATGARSIGLCGSGDRPVAAETAQSASAADVRIISAYTRRATPAEKSSLARSSAAVTSANPGIRNRTAET